MLAKFGDASLPVEGTKESGSQNVSGDGNRFGAWLSLGDDWIVRSAGEGLVGYQGLDSSTLARLDTWTLIL